MFAPFLPLLVSTILAITPSSWQASGQPVGGELAASWRPVVAASCVSRFLDPERGGMPPFKRENVDIIRKQWKGTGDAEIAVAVAYAEHGLNCTGVSPTNDHGLFQLHGIPEYDCHRNTEIAYGMYLRRGFQPWVASKSGAYKKYLTCS